MKKVERKPKADTRQPADAAPWLLSAATYEMGRSHLDGLDALAIEMERKWGVGRLRLIVSPEWREKFDAQLIKLTCAKRHGNVDDVMRECQRMMNAWRKLDAVATEQGIPPLSPVVWDIALPDGTVAALVRSEAEAHAVSADGRHVGVYTLREIATLLAGFPALAKTKSVFPGATVAVVREPVDPYFEGGFSDPLPF